ncbi:hypothetical protein KL867_17740 [Ruegeria litorea]|uniref:Phage tail tube protein n=1 Tax=Falsiruegeria litorea TaxID=1280831 RepID=A0ABS5WYL3_9RHOB|nr:hypothetical protein [Falsiruegeria litorea]MBT3142915.1 hypothetical protein [Falsiruegeria litorea]
MSSVAHLVVAGDLVTMSWSADGTTFEEIPGCKTIGIPEETVEYRDRTSLSSPGRSKEYGEGMSDTGELTLSCHYTSALYKKAAAFKAGKKAVFFKCQLDAVEGQSTGDLFEYTAFINPSVPTTDLDGDLMTDLKLRPTGVVAWTEGTAA